MIAGFMLAFVRSLGEFGATIMVAGNIEGKTLYDPVGHLYSLATAGPDVGGLANGGLVDPPGLCSPRGR